MLNIWEHVLNIIKTYVRGVKLQNRETKSVCTKGVHCLPNRLTLIWSFEKTCFSGKGLAFSFHVHVSVGSMGVS